MKGEGQMEYIYIINSFIKCWVFLAICVGKSTLKESNKTMEGEKEGIVSVCI